MEVWDPFDPPGSGAADEPARVREAAFAILIAMMLGLGGIGVVIGFLAASRSADRPGSSLLTTLTEKQDRNYDVHGNRTKPDRHEGDCR